MLDTANALVSLTDTKTFLKISETSEDALLESFINRASSFVNDYTQRLLLARVNTEYYDGDGTNTLILKQYPVTSITINDDVDRKFLSETELDITNNVIVDSTNGIVHLFNNEIAFDKGTLNVKVVYTAGYSLANVPASIQEAVMLYVGNAYRSQYLHQRFGRTSDRTGDASYIYSNEEIMTQIKNLLNPHRSERAFMYAV